VSYDNSVVVSYDNYGFSRCRILVAASKVKRTEQECIEEGIRELQTDQKDQAIYCTD